MKLQGTAAWRRRRICVFTALVCALSGFALQWLIVHGLYGGNWTALFCTGSAFPVPAALAGENVFVFRGSPGYDGQMYHYVAHDPLLRTEIWRHLDEARHRYRRILLPAVAFLLAGGRQGWIDWAYLGANLLFLYAGAWWLSRYLDLLGLDPRWALLFVLTPAALISLERLTVDLAFTALCVGFALYMRLGRDVAAFALLVLACLCRETGFVLAGAACVASLASRRVAKAVVWAAGAAPAALWHFYVSLRVPESEEIKLSRLVPFRGMLQALREPVAYPFGDAVNVALGLLDRACVLALLAAFLGSLWLLRRNGLNWMRAAVFAWGLLAVCLTPGFYRDLYAAGRVFTPMLTYLVLDGYGLARGRAAIPLLVMMPRYAVQVVGALLFT
ncbi:MAG TPA: hypothetical protein VNJ11_11015 [Bryobacteraceae bacterium]|nr:hypothetical protein [Bryobacteraceae bacterium]